MPELLESLEAGGILAVLSAVSDISDASAGLDAYSALLKELYWKRREIDLFCTLSVAAIQYALLSAARETNPERSAGFLGRAKAFCYDLGSFTWPGWEEPGIRPTAAHMRLGSDAARENYVLAVRLGRGPVPLSRAEWLIGAHHLTLRSYIPALARFEKAAALAAEGDEPAEALLCRGYAVLAAGLAGQPSEAEATEVQNILSQMDGGSELLGQLYTAARVFAAR